MKRGHITALVLVPLLLVALVCATFYVRSHGLPTLPSLPKISLSIPVIRRQNDEPLIDNEEIENESKPDLSKFQYFNPKL